TDTADEASPGQERSGRVTYRIALHQEGARITGEGEKWAEDGRPLPAGSRAAIDLTGSWNGREARLHFVERGAAPTRGTFVWHLSSGGEDLAGSFSAGDAHGSSSAVRLQ
ncbi:MAG: hypothetical protein JOZ15_10920, partial [Acidobacteria bacterium]|nr:hypothetical protein [Acidobacteriota bacterium]